MTDDTKATWGAHRAPQARIGPRMVPLDDLRPHPLNANVMPEDLREKLAAHINRTGRYPFLVVRPHPEEPGKYQVLDGHHRVAVLRELGFTRSPLRCLGRGRPGGQAAARHPEPPRRPGRADPPGAADP